MRKLAFVSCDDLSRYFPSKKNALLTHDDQIACDYLQYHSYEVEALPWQVDVESVLQKNFDLLVIRSPWDYMDTEEKRTGFLHWLKTLSENKVRISNPYEILQWNLDKHYLNDCKKLGIATVPSLFLEPEDKLDILSEALAQWKQIVVKPCISAAAKDTFLIRSVSELEEFLSRFEILRKDRAFLIQPFIKEIESEGEWSLVFIDQVYSHAVLKLPKKGNWLVQDELGGSVQCKEAPDEVREFAEHAFQRLIEFLKEKFPENPYILYARIDIVPGNLLGEIELVEPELFFLDRKMQEPNIGALEKFLKGITSQAKESVSE